MQLGVQWQLFGKAHKTTSVPFQDELEKKGRRWESCGSACNLKCRDDGYTQHTARSPPSESLFFHAKMALKWISRSPFFSAMREYPLGNFNWKKKFSAPLDKNHYARNEQKNKTRTRRARAAGGNVFIQVAHVCGALFSLPNSLCEVQRGEVRETNSFLPFLTWTLRAESSGTSE